MDKPSADPRPSLEKRTTIPGHYRPFLRIGTSSWKFDSWKGLYYEPTKRYRPNDYLADYARQLGSVEVDQWFWSLFPGGIKLPDSDVAQAYAEAVPDDFVFTVKAPNAITLTHFYAKQSQKYRDYANRPNEHFLDNALLEQFLERLSPLGNKLGPIMFQFEYLNRKKMPSRQAFFDQLHAFMVRAPKGFQYAIETRNPNYLSSAFFDFLKEHHLGFVYLEGYYMPHIGDVFDKYQPTTADFAIVRLHGGDRLVIEEETQLLWNRLVAPKPLGLRAAVRIIEANTKLKLRTYVNVNNHFEGSAPVTIDRLLQQLRAQENGRQ